MYLPYREKKSKRDGKAGAIITVSRAQIEGAQESIPRN
jgi:hypothetical protein